MDTQNFRRLRSHAEESPDYAFFMTEKLGQETVFIKLKNELTARNPSAGDYVTLREFLGIVGELSADLLRLPALYDEDLFDALIPAPLRKKIICEVLRNLERILIIHDKLEDEIPSNLVESLWHAAMVEHLDPEDIKAIKYTPSVDF